MFIGNNSYNDFHKAFINTKGLAWAICLSGVLNLVKVWFQTTLGSELYLITITDVCIFILIFKLKALHNHSTPTQVILLIMAH